eukprot:9475468-Pyramimonas_sp.AAC.1
MPRRAGFRLRASNSRGRVETRDMEDGWTDVDVAAGVSGEHSGDVRCVCARLTGQGQDDVAFEVRSSGSCFAPFGHA